MPTINLDRKGFDRLLGKKFPDEQLADRISMLGTDLEKLDKSEIVVEVFPNRPDMLSMQGFVRALKSFMGLAKGLQKFTVKSSGEKVIIDKSVSKVRPFTVCAVVKGLVFDDEKIKDIIQIQEKLHTTFGRNRKKAAIGIYPLEKIKMPIRFLAKKPKEIKFLALDSSREMDGLQMLRDHPTGREYAHLLEGKELFPIFIDANNSILSMPPIINSELTGRISAKTKEVFIECSGADINTLELCLNMIVTALSDMGGQVYSMELEYPDKKIITPNLEPKKWKIDINNVNRLLGLDLKEKEIKDLLEKMGFGYEGGKVLVPAYRADIMHEVDFIEDIAIAYGFENFEEEIPRVSTVAEESGIEKFKSKIAAVLAGLGFLELNTYNLTDRKIQTEMMNSKIEVIGLLNSVSKDYAALRAWMLPSLMEVLRSNKQYEYPQRIFDMGAIFSRDRKQETGVREDFSLGIAIAHSDADFTTAKQVLDYIFRMLGLEYKTGADQNSSFMPGRCAKITVGSKSLGVVGEIAPQVLENWGLQVPVAAIELNLSEMFELL